MMFFSLKSFEESHGQGQLNPREMVFLRLKQIGLGLSFSSAFLLSIIGSSQANSDTYHGSISMIPDTIWDSMQGKTWHEGLGCPQREELRLLLIPFNDFKGQRQTGQMIVAKEVASDVLDIFQDILTSGFRIEKMQLAYKYSGDDDASMNANNSSAFNCRLKTSGKSLSEHSFGKAIDINPAQNPYVTSTVTLPAAGQCCNTPEKRTLERMGMIQRGGTVIKEFEKRGWKWGGDWTSLKDYQHFSTSGT